MNPTLPHRGANRYTELTAFANTLLWIDTETGFKVSSRGWAYQLEGLGHKLITALRNSEKVTKLSTSKNTTEI